MKKILLFTAVILTLSGCKEKLEATEIREKMDACTDNNLSYEVVYGASLNYQKPIVDVYCGTSETKGKK